jgi:hypothetical protein
LIKTFSIGNKLTTSQRTDIVDKLNELGLNGETVPPTGTDIEALKNALDVSIKETRVRKR